MAEEPVTTERLETRLDRLTEAVGEMDRRLSNGLARLEGGFEQMDRRIGGVEARIGSVESLQRWAIGLTVTGWFTLGGLLLAVLVKLP